MNVHMMLENDVYFINSLEGYQQIMLLENDFLTYAMVNIFRHLDFYTYHLLRNSLMIIRMV